MKNLLKKLTVIALLTLSQTTHFSPVNTTNGANIRFNMHSLLSNEKASSPEGEALNDALRNWIRSEMTLNEAIAGVVETYQKHMSSSEYQELRSYLPWQIKNMLTEKKNILIAVSDSYIMPQATAYAVPQATAYAVPQAG